MNGEIPYYTEELREILTRKLSKEYVDEAVAEVSTHLFDRAAELRAEGVRFPEEQATREFGDVREIANAFLKSYPPKGRLDLPFMRWLPEAALLCILFALWFPKSRYAFVLDTPDSVAHGIEAAVLQSLGFGMMLIIPGFFEAFGRLIYPRYRPNASLARMANYGLAFTLIGAACLLELQLTGQATVPASYQRVFASCGQTALLYAAMVVLRSNNWLTNSIIRLLRLVSP
jgi:hypothetical protein